MEWYLVLALIVGSFLVLLLLGTPVAFAFLFVNLLGALLFWGGLDGLRQLTLSVFRSVTTFALMPIPMFVLIGEVMFIAGIAPLALDALDKWLGRIPGRLSLLAVAGGTLFATLSGVSIAGVAMLGSTLAPEMERRGYKKSMSLGPILGSGGLSTMIPPTAMGVLLASLAKISVVAFLISIILPGLSLAMLYVIYILVRCRLQPWIAPTYEVAAVPLREKVTDFARHVLPLGIVIFLVIGVVFLGFATPAEAAATGALASFGLAAGYRKLNWGVVRKTIANTLRITVMIFMIFTGAVAFSQILAFTGVTSSLARLGTELPVAPLILVGMMQLPLLLMGCFMEPLSMLMVTIPIYMPIIRAVGLNPIWFGTILLLNEEVALLSPPFGLSLFTMKGVAPPGTTMGDVYRAAIPFLGLQLIILLAIILFPPLALWLPSKMIIR